VVFQLAASERIDGHLATFAGLMREGLLASSTAVRLEVMAELMAAEADALAGAPCKHRGRSSVAEATAPRGPG
jgi:hypothetical protein